MAYALHVPAPPLAGLVACFWYWEGAPAVIGKELLMPTGEPFIVINLRDDPLRYYAPEGQCETFGPAMISGPRTRPFLIDNQQQDRVFGIQFHPGGSSPFVGMPASELENGAAPLDAVWQGAASELRDRLLGCATPRAMFQVAVSVLLARAKAPIDLHPAVRFSIRQFGCSRQVATVASVCGRTGFSQRHFTQLFREEVGLTPKAFGRVRRFQNVLQEIHPAREVNWTKVALDNGYYDQAHFIHDFREFAGLTPTQYWQRRSVHLNHVPSPE